MRTCSWWRAEGEGGRIRCFLCPRGCLIADGKRGYCGPRLNQGGQLVSLAYGAPAALQVDPIEKKPLAEFMPRTTTFSIGTYGCNLGCSFCQNYHLSRGKPAPVPDTDLVLPPAIVDQALRHGCKSVAFTYNEPTIWAEYAMDIAIAAKKAGLATVLVSNGYITLEAAKDLYPLIDAANIDMKGFSEAFYKEMCDGRLQSVLDAMEYYHSLPTSHLEITNLVIPGKNDDPAMINAYFDWVEKKLNKMVPLHFSAYHPMYKYRESPPTPPSTLFSIKEMAEKRGFHHVHLGNIALY